MTILCTQRLVILILVLNICNLVWSTIILGAACVRERHTNSVIPAINLLSIKIMVYIASYSYTNTMISYIMKLWVQSYIGYAIVMSNCKMQSNLQWRDTRTTRYTIGRRMSLFIMHDQVIRCKYANYYAELLCKTRSINNTIREAIQWRQPGQTMALAKNNSCHYFNMNVWSCM